MKELLNNLIMFMGLSIVLAACEDVEREPVATDGTAPGQVSNVMVKSTPGGSIISYDLPDDIDLLLVEACYTLPNGNTVRVNASSNQRSLSVEGFAKVREYQVELTCVDRSGNRSAPYTVSITPDTPPVTIAFESLKIQPDFGGLNLQWENPAEADLAIMIYQKNEEGENENVDTYYTSAKKGNYSVRGLENKEGEFTVQLRDKWNNLSEKKVEVLTPMFEEQIPGKNMSLLPFEYCDHVEMSDHTQFLSRIWDEDLHEKMITEKTMLPWHASFTISKKNIRLSRVIFFQFGWSYNNYGHYYAGNNGSKYEVYGSSDETPTVDMSGWTLLVTCSIVKPSGLPSMIGRDNMTNEDFDLAHNKGHEFSLPLDAPAVRHLRVRCVDCFGGTMGSFAEMQVFGEPEKDEEETNK